MTAVLDDDSDIVLTATAPIGARSAFFLSGIDGNRAKRRAVLRFPREAGLTTRIRSCKAAAARCFRRP